MADNVWRVSWYWFRTSVSRRATSYLAIVLLVGTLGGLAMGSVIASRRTSSSFNVFLARTNPSDLNIVIGAPDLTADLSKLPLVRHVATADFYIGVIPVGPAGRLLSPKALNAGEVVTVGSLSGEYFTQDRVTVVDGRMANPSHRDQFVATTVAAKLMGWHVGESIPLNFYTGPQTSLPGYGTNKVKPTVSLTMTLVGTVVPNDDVVLDEVDRYPTFVIFTPALSKMLVTKGFTYLDYGVQLTHGARDVSAVEREIIKALPRGTTYNFAVTSDVTSQVNRSIEPDAIALGIFGLIAALAALIIAASLIARLLQSEGENLSVLRALGATPRTVANVVVLGVLISVIAGAALALVVAVALTPLSPIGPVRTVYPLTGVHFDWLVLGLGFVITVAVLAAVSWALAWRGAQSAQRNTRTGVASGAGLARRLGELGLPVTLVTGVRFALQPGRDRDAVPVRTALLGSVLAVTLVIATVTFGSGLSTLVSRPPLYGWNWNYALTGNGASIPPQSVHLLKESSLVKAVSGVNFVPAQIDGVNVPSIVENARAAVSPPILSGHGLEANDQIVLGAATMQELHKRLGDTVMASYGGPQDYPVYIPPRRLTIVGTATLPAVGSELTSHPSMGSGAIVPAGILPAAMAKFLHSPYPALNGPKMVFVRLKAGVSAATAMTFLKHVDAVGDKALYAVPDGLGEGDSLAALPVQYPAEIENYRSIGDTPAILALVLAGGACGALGLTLLASVRRRRRELAMLRALGFSRRQLRSTIFWQASVAGATGVVVGVPLGIVLGRWLWTLFARYIDAVPEPTVPVVTVIVIAASALLVVNLVAMIPGRNASHVSTAQVLRGE
ncbi:MAG: FtsX-like permease family protein [Acidimicrobiales bacterium]